MRLFRIALIPWPWPPRDRRGRRRSDQREPCAAAPAHTNGDFASPSGNIACDVFARDDSANFATCDIHDHTYAAPPKPVGCQLRGRLITATTDPPAAAVPSKGFTMKRSS